MPETPIPTPPKPPNSLRILQAKTERLKGWGTIITIIATGIVSLTTGVTAHLKEQDETTTRMVYEELSRDIKKISEDNARLRSDMENIHEYLRYQSQVPLSVVEEDKRTLAEMIAEAIKKDPDPRSAIRLKPLTPPNIPQINERQTDVYKPRSFEEVKRSRRLR